MGRNFRFMLHMAEKGISSISILYMVIFLLVKYKAVLVYFNIFCANKFIQNNDPNYMTVLETERFVRSRFTFLFGFLLLFLLFI